MEGVAVAPFSTATISITKISTLLDTAQEILWVHQAGCSGKKAVYFLLVHHFLCLKCNYTTQILCDLPASNRARWGAPLAKLPRLQPKL